MKVFKLHLPFDSPVKYSLLGVLELGVGGNKFIVGGLLAEDVEFFLLDSLSDFLLLEALVFDFLSVEDLVFDFLPVECCLSDFLELESLVLPFFSFDVLVFDFLPVELFDFLLLESLVFDFVPDFFPVEGGFSE